MYIKKQNYYFKFQLGMILLLSTSIYAADNHPAEQVDACDCVCTVFAGDNLIADLGTITIKGRICRSNENGEACSHPDFPAQRGKKTRCQNTTKSPRKGLKYRNSTTVDGSIKVAPNSSSRSQKNKFKNKTLTTLPVSSKRSPVVRDHRKPSSKGPSKNSPKSSGLVAPSDLAVSNVTRNTLTLSWRDNSNREFGVELYRVNPVEARRNPAKSWKMIGKFEERNQSSVTGSGMRSDKDFNLKPGTNYCYRMRSYSGFDRSEVSGFSKVVCTMTRL